MALIAISIPLLRSGSGAMDIGTNSVARLNGNDGSLAFDPAALGQRPGASAIGFESLWVAEPDQGVVARVSLEDGSVTDPNIGVGNAPSGVAIGDGSVWVTNAGDGTVSRIDPGTDQTTQVISVGTSPTGIAFGDGALWIADTIGVRLVRLDPNSGEIRPVPLAGEPSGVAFTPSGVWVSVAPAGIARVDPADPHLSVTLTYQAVGNGPTAVLYAFGSIWVANHLDGTVSRLDPSTGEPEDLFPVRDGSNALAASTDSLWVANELDGSISAIDPNASIVEPAIPVGGEAASLVTDGDGLWLAVGASPSEHVGGTLTVSSAVPAPASLDPAGYDPTAWQLLSITNDGLLAYKKVGGPDGNTLVPDLASALPEESPDGRTYRFPLREGIRRYSTGDPVLPVDFRYGLERSVALDRSLAGLYGAIVGVKACKLDPSTCDLSAGIVVDDQAVTFHLERPDPDLPFKLALPAAFPVPAAIPVEDQGRTPLPATGPYMIAEAGAGGIELVRNEQFHEWAPAAQPAGFVNAISWRFNEKPAGAFDRLKAGGLDLMTDPPPPRISSGSRPPTRTRSCAGRAWPRSTSAWTLGGHRSTMCGCGKL